MLEEKTTIDTIEIAEDGTIRLRFALLVIKDGAVVSRKWHRTTIPPGGDVDAQIAAVNDDITMRPDLMAPAVDTTRMQELRGVAGLVHTPEVVAAHHEREAAERAALEQRLETIDKAAGRNGGIT